MTVAALYVEAGGVYFGLDDVDPWDEARDARLYDGPHPVVAHPPCTRWSRLAAITGRYDGRDGGCFAAALAAVREFGGVLEHPAHSLAWRTFDLPIPVRWGWSATLGDPGVTTEIDQWCYGHPTTKPTWLYAVVAASPVAAMRWDEPPPGTPGHEDMHGGGSQHMRSRTPVSFRDVLIEMARSARVAAA